MDGSGNLYGTTSYGGASGAGTVFELVHTQSQVTPLPLKWDTSQGGVDFGYQVSGGSVPKDTQVSLYWSPTQTYDPNTATLIPRATQDIPAGTQAKTYGPFTVTPATLGPPPPEAKYLLVVTDPNNVMGNFDPNRNVASFLLPDIAIDSAQLQQGVVSFSGETINYPNSFLVGLYQSADGKTYDSSHPLHVLTLTPSSSDSRFVGTFLPIDTNQFDPSRPFLLVVADPNNDIIVESYKGNNLKVAGELLILKAKSDIPNQIASSSPDSSIEFSALMSTLAKVGNDLTDLYNDGSAAFRSFGSCSQRECRIVYSCFGIWYPCSRDCCNHWVF